jgi:uncharacterized membrane protein YhhN
MSLVSNPAIGCLAIAISAMVTVVLDWRRRHPGFGFFKLLTTALIIGLTAQRGADAPLLLALALCWGGDAALLGHGTRAFVAGLVLFLLGHVVFLLRWGAALHAQGWSLPPAAVLVTDLALLLAAVGYLRWLWPRTGRLAWPVLVYMTVLMAMTLAALWLASLSGGTAWRAAAGALLFAASDAMLAWRRFVRPPVWGQAFTLISYYGALTLIGFAS